MIRAIRNNNGADINDDISFSSTDAVCGCERRRHLAIPAEDDAIYTEVVIIDAHVVLAETHDVVLAKATFVEDETQNHIVQFLEQREQELDDDAPLRRTAEDADRIQSYRAQHQAMKAQYESDPPDGQIITHKDRENLIEDSISRIPTLTSPPQPSSVSSLKHSSNFDNAHNQMSLTTRGEGNLTKYNSPSLIPARQLGYPITEKSVCFEWHDHPGTLMYRKVVTAFSQAYCEWDDMIFDRVLEKLAEEDYNRFLVFLDANNQNPCDTIHEGLWYIATESEILEHTRKQFLSGRHETETSPRQQLQALDGDPLYGSVPLGHRNASHQCLQSGFNDVNKAKSPSGKVNISSSHLQNQSAYPIAKKSVCFDSRHHPGTRKFKEAVRAFSQIYREWDDTIFDGVMKNLAEEDFNRCCLTSPDATAGKATVTTHDRLYSRFLVFLDSNGKPSESIHDGLWYVATENEIREKTKQQFIDDKEAPHEASNDNNLQQAMSLFPSEKRSLRLRKDEEAAFASFLLLLVDPNAKNNHGYKLLQLAISNRDNKPIITSLMEHAKADFGLTLRHSTISRESNPIVPALLEHAKTHHDGWTPRHSALSKMYNPMVPSLLEHAKNNGGWTRLHFAVMDGVDDFLSIIASTNRSEDIFPNENEAIKAVIALMLELDIYPNEQNKSREKLLHLAVQHGDTEVVKFLLEHQAVPNTKDTIGRTPLYTAIMHRNKEVVALLLRHEADPNVKHRNGETLLHYLVKHADHTDVVRLLLEHQANPNTTNTLGETPLHAACMYGNEKAVALLLQHQADPNIKDQNGCTPLHWACLYGFEGVVRLLLEHQANPDEKNDAGKTPRDLAVTYGHDAIVNLMTTLEKDRQTNPQSAG